jgi:hypothetical protein
MGGVVSSGTQCIVLLIFNDSILSDALLIETVSVFEVIISLRFRGGVKAREIYVV